MADPTSTDPWAWNAQAQTQDPSVYGWQGQGGIGVADLATAKPALVAAGVWNPAWDAAAANPTLYTPTIDPESGNVMRPAQQSVDLSALNGYQLGQARSSGYDVLHAVLGPNGQPISGGQLGVSSQQGAGSLKGNDYASMAAVAGTVLGAGYGAEALGGAGTAGSAAGATNPALIESASGTAGYGASSAGLGGGAAAAGDGALTTTLSNDMTQLPAGMSTQYTGAGVDTAANGATSTLPSSVGGAIPAESAPLVSDASPALSSVAGGSSPALGSAATTGFNWGSLVSPGLSLLGSGLTSNAIKSAAQTQADAATQAAQVAAAQRQPWVNAGTGALNQLTAMTQPGGQLSKTFTMADAQNMPAMQFSLDQGTQAINNSAAAKGGLLTSNNLQNATQFAEGNAAQYENQAFNQFIAGQQQLASPLLSLAGLGAPMVNATADTNANAVLAAGGANAAGTVANANNWSNYLSNAGNQANTMSALSNIFGTPSSSTPNSTASTGYNFSGSANDPWGTNVSFSDARLKEDIVRVGKTDDGIPIYRYKMKAGGPVQMGVMAQELEVLRPSAVRTHRSGFKMVDYDMVT